MHRKVRYQMEDNIAKFKNEDFSGIRAQFPLLLKVFLSEKLLRRGWRTIQLLAGPIVSIGAPKISMRWLLNTASVPIQCKRTKIIMVLQTTKSGTVVGLRFVPSDLSRLSLTALRIRETVQVWRRPDYDVPHLYEDIRITLGSRQNAVAGTLSLPRSPGKFPCVILIGGSGPCDQDSTVQAAKPFKDMACGLAKEGIAVLRFDKVTFTHGRRLAKKQDYTLTEEYWEHATAAVEVAVQQPNIEAKSIFLAGHSLGAVITPKLAASTRSVAGFILMAAPARSLYWCAIQQLEYLSKLESAENADHDDVALQELRKAAVLADSAELSKSTPADELPFGIGPSYWLDYRNYQPVSTTHATEKPVLILQGENDYQVTVLNDYVRWQATLKDRNNVDFRKYKQLNHLFMHCTGPSGPNDYKQACNMDYPVIKDIAQWIRANQKRTVLIDRD